MEWIVIFGIGFVFLMAISVANGINANKEKVATEEKLASEKKLDEVFVFKHPATLSTPTPYMLRRGVTLNADTKYMIGVNWENERLLFGGVTGPFEIDFDCLAEIEFIQNDQSVTKTNRGSQLAGAAIGAVALGGVGAIIGGLSGSSRTKSKVKSIDIRIGTDHAKVLGFKVSFFKSATNAGDNPDGIVVQHALPEAEKWYSVLQRAMKQAQSKKGAAPSKPAEDSIEARIERLWKLKESGALTDEEYTEQKRKILSAL